MAVADGAEPISLQEQEKPSTSPLMDSWKLFRRNKASVVAVIVLAIIVVLAMGARLWTELGLLDARGGAAGRDFGSGWREWGRKEYADEGAFRGARAG